jgi:GNAT superfamily N-acetyltransferase
MKRASPNDVPQLVAMMNEFYAESGYPLNHQRATEAFATLLADDRLGYVWFIQADGQDVGYVVLTLCYSMEYGGPNAFVDDLFVRMPFRRTGLATAALTEVRAFCAKRGVRALHVETGRDNAAGQAVYRRIGFTPTDRQLLTLQLTNPTHASQPATAHLRRSPDR